MSDGKPKRPARPAKPDEISSGNTVSNETGPSSSAAEPPEPAFVTASPKGGAEPTPAPPAASSQPALQSASASPEPQTDSADDAWTAFVAAQSVLARGFYEITAEVTGMTRSGIATAADAAVALLGVRTLAEAVEITATLARRGVDAMIENSAKLSEIGVRATSDASRPILSRLGESWSSLALGDRR